MSGKRVKCFTFKYRSCMPVMEKRRRPQKLLILWWRRRTGIYTFFYSSLVGPLETTSPCLCSLRHQQGIMLFLGFGVLVAEGLTHSLIWITALLGIPLTLFILLHLPMPYRTETIGGNYPYQYRPMPQTPVLRF